MEAGKNEFGPNLQEYRSLLGESLLTARTVDGSEEMNNALLDVLMRFEEWKKNNFDLPEKDAEYREEWEQMIGNDMRPNRSVNTIHDLLTMGESRVKRIAGTETDPEVILEQFKIVRRKVDDVLIIPKKSERVIVSGEGEWEPTRFEPRLQALIHALRTKGIYTDDMIATTGIVLPNQMRKISYVLLEIPRIGSEALVCNEVEEATFVSRRHLGHDTYTLLNKEQLQAIPGVSRHICKNLQDWSSEIANALLDNKQIREKSSMKDIEKICTIITDTYTSAQWLGMTQGEKRALLIEGNNIYAIAKIFGVRGDAVEKPTFMQLAACIYGEQDPVILEATNILRKDARGWADEIKRSYTAEQWVSLKAKEKTVLHVHGKGLQGIARIFGIEENPIRNHEIHIALGVKIYGGDDASIIEALKKAEKVESQTWIDAVKKNYPTASAWLSLKQRDKSKVKILGKGMKALGGIFGVKGNPSTFLPGFVELTEKIYGTDDPAVIAKKDEMRTREILNAIMGEDRTKWCEAIKEVCPNKREWMSLVYKQKVNMKIQGKGIRAIARIFGLKTEDPLHDMEAFETLGSLIYKDNPLPSSHVSGD